MSADTAATDDALIQRLLARDEAAFADLVATYHNSLTRLALTFVADRGAAEEVVQETWLGVITGLPAFERRSSLKTWIFRILANRARTRGMRDSRFVNFSTFGELDAAPSDIADRFSAAGYWTQPPSTWQEKTPEELLLRREAADWLQEAIASLPPQQRAVISLRDIDGIEAQEICNILGISETNQRVLLHRARTKIRAALEDHLKRK